MKNSATILFFVLCLPMSVFAEGIEKLEQYKTKDFTLKVPSEWRKLDLGGKFSLFLQGDGIQLPATDEGSPLQAGLTVERYENIKESVVDGAKKLGEASKQAPRFKALGDPTISQIKLPDGSDAALLTVQGIKDGTRSSLQMKLLVKAEGEVGFVVSAFLVGGEKSKIAVPTSSEAKSLIECLKSISLTSPQKPTKTEQDGGGQPATRPESK